MAKKSKASGKSPSVKAPFLKVDQGDTSFYLTKLTAGVLGVITYASIRGQDNEEGAVQRILNTRRISSIADFANAVGHFPNSIVLNWVNTKEKIIAKDGSLEVPIATRSAQLIDGQHRVEGLRAALETNPEIRDLEIPVAIYQNLSTAQCANIFLSINTEQKPVPRSLVYDLYGIADVELVDAAAVRARDIAIALNEDEDSPYRNTIKFPGSPRSRGGIALSTVVTAMKPLVDIKGDFEQRNIFDLETQKKIIKNFFSAISQFYGERWYEPTNAFMYAAGFSGGTDFLKTKMLAYCQDRKSFTQKTMKDAFSISVNDLILQEEVKGKGGKEATLFIQERLTGLFKLTSSKGNDYEV
ncbi:DGQHR domain-containing protein [Bradyrhizobium manausense]|uniref:DGQHR domain-containing protein n=1 Tax=Bradyrhizobium manausense TaxID=989370 RepID=UPI001BA56A52|nr:DGQHR domain-containing protein [Bradyrhizobium manausense]